MKKKRILITGAAGSIGSELVRQLCKDNLVYGIDINESGLADLMNECNFPGRVADIRNAETVRDIYSDFKPHIVYHAAALKHVPLMEITPMEAIQTNIIGTYNMIHYAKIYEVEKFVFISTDKAVQSTSILGATKRVGEIITRNQGKGFVVVRFGNVLGSRGSVIPIWQKQIQRKEAITVTHEEMTRYMMTIEEACSLVIEAGRAGKGGEIFILDMGEPINVLEMAKEIARQSKSGIKMIGVRKGEAMHEKLMFEEEKLIAIKKDKFYIIYAS